VGARCVTDAAANRQFTFQLSTPRTSSGGGGLSDRDDFAQPTVKTENFSYGATVSRSDIFRAL